MNNMTMHARTRSQQRGIPPMLVDLLLQFGSERQQNGATVYYFDRRARRNLDAYVGGIMPGLDKWLGTFVVLGSNKKVVTTYFRDMRIKQK